MRWAVESTEPGDRGLALPGGCRGRSDRQASMYYYVNVVGREFPVTIAGGPDAVTTQSGKPAHTRDAGQYVRVASDQLPPGIRDRSCDCHPTTRRPLRSAARWPARRPTKFNVARTGSIHSKAAEHIAVTAQRELLVNAARVIWQSRMEKALAHQRPTAGIQVKIIATSGG
jgi:hypothetical protein